jgi:hypothetical protein
VPEVVGSTSGSSDDLDVLANGAVITLLGGTAASPT